MRAVFARCKGVDTSCGGSDWRSGSWFRRVQLIIDVCKSAPRQDILTFHEAIQKPLLPNTIVQQSLIPPVTLSIFGKCIEP